MRTMDKPLRPERGHSCPQHVANALGSSRTPSSTRVLLRTRMSALRALLRTEMSALLMLAVLTAAGAAQGAIFTDTVNQAIPDGGADLTVLSRTINVSGLAPT